jgi:hypothetical protein
MSSIKTYDDLIAEEKRLQALLYSHKESIRDSFAATKESLNPFKAAINTAKSLFTRSKTNPLAKFGVDFGVDVFLRRFVLARAGWFTKIVLPFVVKNYSTYVIKERHKYKFLNKIVGFFKDTKNTAKAKAGKVKDNIVNTADDINENLHNTVEDIHDSAKDIQQSTSTSTF